MMQNDATVGNRIERIKIEYHRKTLIKPGAIPDGADWEYVTWDYSEHLIVDRETEMIEHFQKIGSECDVTRRYHVAEGVSGLLDSYDLDTFLVEIEGNPDDVIEDPLETKEYRIEIVYRNSPIRIIMGSYDKRALPNDWPEFMNDLLEFMRFYGIGEILDPDVYGKAKRRNVDLMFVYVSFGDFGRQYTYLCEDPSIEDGDEVLVPVGTEGRITRAVVEGIKYLPAAEAPYPLDKIKTVIGRCEESTTVYCPVAERNVCGDECMGICFDVDCGLTETFIGHSAEKIELTNEKCSECENCPYH